MKKQKEQGAIMVEATLYFPITIAVVMVVLYLGLLKIQESYFFFQVEKAASQISREIAYPGYDSFLGDDWMKNSTVDFPWEEGPTAKQVKDYYGAYNGSVTKIYRLGLERNLKEQLQKYQEDLCKTSALFSMGTTQGTLQVQNSFMSKSVLAEIRYEIPTPGIIRFLGVKDTLTLFSGAYQPVINPTDFVRNVDLGWDLGEFLLEKLGLKGKADAFAEKFNKIKKILF